MTPAAIGGRSAGRSMRELGEQRAQRLQGGELLGLEGGRIGQRLAVDLGRVAEGAPDDVGGDADDRVAPANGAAFHQLQQAAHGLPVAQLQRRRDRRLEVGDKPRPHHLRLALAVALGKRGARRQGLEIGRRPRRAWSSLLVLPARGAGRSFCLGLLAVRAQRLLQGGLVDGMAIARLQSRRHTPARTSFCSWRASSAFSWLTCSGVGAAAGMTSATRRMMRALPSGCQRRGGAALGQRKGLLDGVVGQALGRGVAGHRARSSRAWRRSPWRAPRKPPRRSGAPPAWRRTRRSPCAAPARWPRPSPRPGPPRRASASRA